MPTVDNSDLDHKSATSHIYIQTKQSNTWKTCSLCESYVDNVYGLPTHPDPYARIHQSILSNAAKTIGYIAASL